MSKLYFVVAYSHGLGYQGTSIREISSIFGIYKSKEIAEELSRKIWNSKCLEIETDLIQENNND
jgi:hypothetical protein